MTVTLAATGAVADLTDAGRATLLDRRASFADAVTAARAIGARVQAEGDAAVLALTAEFDGVDAATFTALEVPQDACDAALRRLPAATRDALVRAHRNIERYHTTLVAPPQDVEVTPGLVAGRRFLPLERVGCYVPGGRASYPSTVLMTATPARVAGVDEVIVATPPGPDGRVPDATLAACAVAGVDRVFAMGGAQAVFALAYGTATVPRVDKIVGPGNAFVAAAKALVASDVAIDAPAGPSEVLVLHTGPDADEGDDLLRDAGFAAAEMLAQAEHDPEAACVTVTTDAAFAAAVVAALEAGIATAPRRDVIAAALAKRGAVLVAADNAAAEAFSDAFAPEHLVVLAAEPRITLERLRHYGSAFLGPWSTVALGDYAAGPNHVLPTAGLVRSFSALATEDFLRRPTHQTATAEGLRALARVVTPLAELEGLHAHAAAVAVRLTALDGGPPA